MGLLSVIRKQKLKDLEIRVLVLGLDNAGKTTILNQTMGRDVTKVAPTMGFQILSFPWYGYNINAWDVGGQTTLRSFWGNYFDKLDVVVWVIDGTCLERLPELYTELREKVIQQDHLAGTYFCVIINKIDMVSLQDRVPLLEAVTSALRLQEEIPRDKYIITMTSGLTGEGLREVMDWVVSKWAY